MLFGKKFRTQLPQAVGAAYSLKMDGKSACAVTFCGDGATSEVSDDEHEHFLLRK
jgi:TPP-dependent pyruvate/acetoin dehydrogenase alpha subunit